MSKIKILEHESVPMKDQRGISVTTRQALINLATQAVIEVCREIYEVQGDYVIKNNHVSELFKERIKKVINDPDTIGEIKDKKITFISRVSIDGQEPIDLQIKRNTLNDSSKVISTEFMGSLDHI